MLDRVDADEAALMSELDTTMLPMSLPPGSHHMFIPSSGGSLTDSLEGASTTLPINGGSASVSPTQTSTFVPFKAADPSDDEPPQVRLADLCPPLLLVQSAREVTFHEFQSEVQEVEERTPVCSHAHIQVESLSGFKMRESHESSCCRFAGLGSGCPTAWLALDWKGAAAALPSPGSKAGDQDRARS